MDDIGGFARDRVNGFGILHEKGLLYGFLVRIHFVPQRTRHIPDSLFGQFIQWVDPKLDILFAIAPANQAAGADTERDLDDLKLLGLYLHSLASVRILTGFGSEPAAALRIPLTTLICPGLAKTHSRSS